MADNKELIFLAVIAVIAVIGIILMLKFSSTGLGMYGGSLYPGRAVEKIAEERFFKGGNPEGVIVDTQTRGGYKQYMGMSPCPEKYTQISKGQYLSKPGYYGACIPTEYPEHYVGIVCCLQKFDNR